MKTIPPFMTAAAIALMEHGKKTERIPSMYNPLLRFPRNNPCFCGSKKKAKKCCLPRVARLCSKVDGDKVKESWSDILEGKILLKG